MDSKNKHKHPVQPDNEKIFKTTRIKAVLKVFKNSFKINRRNFLYFCLGYGAAIGSLVILRFGFNVTGRHLKNLIDKAGYGEVREAVEKMEQEKKLTLAQDIIIKAWKNEKFLNSLIINQEKALLDADIKFEKAEDYKLVFVKNDKNTHNLIVCTLCGCYPRNILGAPPSWYKSFEYRSKAVYEPRQLLQEFGVNVGNKKIVVNDSDQRIRYFVIPEKPKEFEKLSDDELRTMITRDLIIGIKTLS